MIPPPAKEYLDFLAAFEPRITELALAVRAIVLEEAPGAFELPYDVTNAVAAAFTFTAKPNQAFIHIAAYSSWVNLSFNKGVDLPDPGRILRGESTFIRHIRISSIADTERFFVRRFVREAVLRAQRPAAVILTEPKPVVRAIYAKRKRPTGAARGNRGAGSKPV